jgi:hypothetical protein
MGLEGNETVDKRARHAALNGAVFERPLPPVDFQGLARSVLLRDWQAKRNAADTDRFLHSILPKFSLRPWFEGQREDKKFVSTVSIIMSGHCRGSDMYTEKSEHVEELIHQYYEGLVKDIQTVDSVISYN